MRKYKEGTKEYTKEYDELIEAEWKKTVNKRVKRLANLLMMPKGNFI